MELNVQPRPQSALPARCPLCLTEPGAAAIACEGCGSRLHLGCVAELGEGATCPCCDLRLQSIAPPGRSWGEQRRVDELRRAASLLQLVTAPTLALAGLALLRLVGLVPLAEPRGLQPMLDVILFGSAALGLGLIASAVARMRCRRCRERVSGLILARGSLLRAPEACRSCGTPLLARDGASCQRTTSASSS